MKNLGLGRGFNRMLLGLLTVWAFHLGFPNILQAAPVGELEPTIGPLGLTVTDSPDPVPPGGALTYTIVVRNDSTDLVATNVVLTFTPPSGVTVGSPPAGCTNSSGIITCPLGLISAGGSKTLGSIGVTLSTSVAVCSALGSVAKVTGTMNSVAVSGQYTVTTNVGSVPDPFPQPGALDKAFNCNGKKSVSFRSYDYAHAIALDPGGSGKFRVAGMACLTPGADCVVAVASFNSNGSLDMNFGTGGKVTAAALPEHVTVNTSDHEGHPVFFESYDKILVTGTRGNYSADFLGFIPLGKSAGIADFAVLRYKYDSVSKTLVLDNTFDGDGIKKFDVGGWDDQAESVFWGGAGKIWALGSSIAYGHGNAAIASIHADDGSLVISKTMDLGGAPEDAPEALEALTPMDDGTIVAVGWIEVGDSNRDLAIVLYDPFNTLPKWSFSSTGIQTLNLSPPGFPYEAATAVVAKSGADAKIFVAFNEGGFKQSMVGLLCLQSDGSRCMGFGTDGVVLTDIAVDWTDGYYDQVRAIKRELTPSGEKIIMVGRSASSKFAVLRYDANTGALDPSFGADGMATTPFGAGHVRAEAMTILTGQNRLLVVGSGGGDFAIARYVIGAPSLWTPLSSGASRVY